MGQTANQLIDECASELNRVPTLGSIGTNAADSQTLLNETLRNILNEYNFSWRVIDPPVSIATVTTQSVYDISAALSAGALPQSIFAIILDTTTTNTYPLNGIPIKTFLSKWANLDYIGTTYPRDYCRLDKYKFKLAPRPSASNWTLKVYYTTMFQDITVFTTDLDTFLVPKAREAVKIGLLGRMYRWCHEFETALGMLRLADKKIAELVDENKTEPDEIYEMQPAIFGTRPFRVDYWKSPFVRGI